MMTFPSRLLESSLVYLVGFEWGMDILKIEYPLFYASTPSKKLHWFEVVTATSTNGVVTFDKVSDKEYSVVYFPNRKKGDNVLLVQTHKLKPTLTGFELADLIIRRAEIRVEEIIEQGIYNQLEAKKSKLTEPQ